MEPKDRIDAFRELLEAKYVDKLIDNLRQDKRRLTIDFPDLLKYNPDLAEDLLDDPEETLKAGEIAIKSFDSIGDFTGFKLRVRGDLPATNRVRIRDLRSIHLNKFIQIEGTIETKTDVAVRITSIWFECPSCGTTIPTLQIGETIQEPQKCSCGRKVKFRILDRKMIDAFNLRVQELSSSIKYGSSMQAKSVLCEGDLTQTLIEERLVEGIKVKINGIYKEKYVSKQGTKQTQLMTYIEANYIHVSDETYNDIVLTEKDVQQIKEYSKTPNLMKTMCDNLFRGVYGQDKIKEAIVLQGFGGVSNYNMTPRVRGDIHILLVGDAGQNKSVYLEYIEKFAPKCKVCVGKTVSVVGLSGATIKDELTGSYVLKPGVIPLANGGIICIDELDKMKLEDRDILHEPMEQQVISISKANLPDRKMLARESFMVSMNPKNGYFDPYAEIYGQIDLPPTLLSRFDLVYILKKNKDKTEEVRKHEYEKARIMMTRANPEYQQQLDSYCKFARKYMAYARQNIFPKFDSFLSETYIPEKYARFDYERKSLDDTKQDFPITPRHMFVIKRIAEAHARMHLRCNVTVEDVDYAIDKIRDSLMDIALNVQTGKIDVELVQDGVSEQTKNMYSSFDKIYDSVESGGLANTDEFVNKMVDAGFERHKVEELLDKKRRWGEIIYPRGYTHFQRLK